MHFNQSRLGAGAAVLAGVLTVAVAASGNALAGQTRSQGGGRAQSTALPSWYHSPLTAAQLNAEVTVPKSLDYYTGPMRLTHDAFTAGSGALAVDAGQALGHALAQGEDLQLTNAFLLDGATPSAATRSELAKIAWSNVTNVTCEGYTDYGPHSYEARPAARPRSRRCDLQPPAWSGQVARDQGRDLRQHTTGEGRRPRQYPSR